MNSFKHKYPFNINKNLKYLFKPDKKYLKVNLKTKVIRNCFVSNYGIVIKNGLLVKGSVPNVGLSLYDKNQYYNHWRNGIEQFLVCRFGSSLESINLDDDTEYMLIHSPWFSYYFWLTECLPRLLRGLNSHPNATLLYPESWNNYSFVKDSLSLLPSLKIKHIPDGVHLFVNKLILPEVKPWTPMFIPQEIGLVKDFFLSNIDLSSHQLTQLDKVYISRKSAKRRKFSNEELIEEELKKRGFYIAEMENLSLYQQIALMQHTKVLVGMTGAGLINIMFLSDNSGFLDLTNELYKTRDQYKFHYFKLCNQLEIEYGVCFFAPENEPSIDHWSNQNLVTDINVILENIDELEKKILNGK